MIKNFFTQSLSIPTGENEGFEDLLHSKHLRIERISSKPFLEKEAKWYDQEDNEWVILLQGEAFLEFEDSKPLHLKSGDYLFIPAHTKHRLTQVVKDSLWLAIFEKA